MKTTWTKWVMASLTVGLVFGAPAVEPTISDVTVRQRWPWSRLVDIDYVLTCDDTQQVDVVLSAYNGPTALTLPSTSLSGDLYGVSDGPHRIVWDPAVTVYTNNQMLTQFNVALTTAEIPLYMIVDLTKSAGADGQIEYVYAGDTRLETYGRWTNVWFGVTNDSTYATAKVVLRRVSAGEFQMGDATTVATTLTTDFYMGVFEMTQEQWKNVTGSYRGGFTVDRSRRPVETASYVTLRGATNDSPSINWPTTGHAVSTGSFIGTLRAKTGLKGFDLPTEAQWEYACRAGTSTLFNDGDAAASTSGANTYSNQWLDVLGRYAWNGGKYWTGTTWTDASAAFGPTNGTAIVGSYLPNDWGIYDMHGNLWELCLDWLVSPLAGGTDPLGPNVGTLRCKRGGSWRDDPYLCVSGHRDSYNPANGSWSLGFRIALVLP